MHFGDGGIQAHSMGPEYPWSAVTHGGARIGGYIRAENLVTGQVMDKHYFQWDHVPGDAPFFEEAHAAAVASIPAGDSWLGGNGAGE